ncbi:MAG: tetratricopeptide repeat protein, partial [Bacteroidetes bacterium]|nr:tetratricopeptide repeat protein [Bacteroidota bacterium]
MLEEQREAKQIETYYSLAKLHQQENVDSALISLQKGLSLAQQLNLGELIIEGYNALAIHWYYRGQTDSGLVWVQKSLKILPDTPSLARGTSYSHYGLLLAQQGRYEDATLWHLQALKESETLGDSAGVVRSQHNLGRVYGFLGDIDQAVNWYKKALELSQLLGQESHSAKILGNLGQIMLNAGRLEEAFSYQTQSLSI